MNKKVYYLIALVSILSVGAYLRFANITTQGLIRWDEGYYLIDSLNISSLNLYGKPVHKLIVMAGYALFGIHDYAGKVMSGILGLLTIIVIYLTGEKLYNKTTGLVAALLLGISYNHIYFSRLAHAQADSTFFVVLATFLYVSYRFSDTQKRRYLILCGISLALSFMSHPNVAPFIIFFLIVEALYVLARLKETRSPSELKPLIFLGLSMVSPLIIQEVFSRLFIEGKFNSYIMTTFFYSRWDVNGYKIVVGAYGDYLYFFKEILNWEGPFKLALAVISFLFLLILAAMKKTDKRDWFVLGLAAFPIAFWTINTSWGDNDRMYTVLSIGIDLMVARFAFGVVEGLVHSIRKPSAATAAHGMAALALAGALAVITWQNVDMSLKFLKQKSSFPRIAAQVQAICPGPIIMPSEVILNPALSYYFAVTDRRIVVKDLDEAKALFKPGGPRCFLLPRYAPSERLKYDEFYKYRFNLTRKIEAGLSKNGTVRPVIDFGGFAAYDLGRIVKQGN